MFKRVKRCGWLICRPCNQPSCRPWRSDSTAIAGQHPPKSHCHVQEHNAALTINTVSDIGMKFTKQLHICNICTTCGQAFLRYWYSWASTVHDRNKNSKITLESTRECVVSCQTCDNLHCWGQSLLPQNQNIFRKNVLRRGHVILLWDNIIKKVRGKQNINLCLSQNVPKFPFKQISQIITLTSLWDKFQSPPPPKSVQIKFLHRRKGG